MIRGVDHMIGGGGSGKSHDEGGVDSYLLLQATCSVH